jgi:AraC-like DNA-binding protein
MTPVDLIRNLDQLSQSVQENVHVQRLAPSDFPAIGGYLSESVNPSPHIFRFYVPEEELVLSVRLQGNSILQASNVQASSLVLPGRVVIYPPGEYSTIFGRGACTTMFLTCHRSLLPEQPINKLLRSELPPTTSLDLENDPLMEGISAISDPSRPQSYFKFAALLTGLLERTCHDSGNCGSQLPAPKHFDKLCKAVVANPASPWSTSDAASFCGYSVHHFSRTFRVKEGIGFAEFVRQTRATVAMQYLCDKNATIEQSIKRAGIDSISEANTLFRNELGLTLGEIKQVLKYQVGFKLA